MGTVPKEERSDLLARLQTWYLSNCDGEREHRHGIHIQSLDNPGWLVEIDIGSTVLKRKVFTEIQEGIGDGGHPTKSQWLHCSVTNGKWQGAADAMQLSRLLKLFLDWVAEAPLPSEK